MPVENEQQQEQEQKSPVNGASPDDKKIEVDPDTESALKVYKALNGPNGVKVLEALAGQAGLKLSQVENKKEATAAKKDIKAFLRENMEGYEFLADKLAPALDQLFAERFGEIENRFKERDEKSAESEADEAIAQVSKEFEDWKIHEPAIIKLMDEFSIGKGIKFKTYLTNLYKLAKSQANEGTEKKKPTTLAERLKKSQTDVGARVAPASAGGEHKKKLSDRPNLREAITATLDELETEE